MDALQPIKTDGLPFIRALACPSPQIRSYQGYHRFTSLVPRRPCLVGCIWVREPILMLNRGGWETGIGYKSAGMGAVCHW